MRIAAQERSSACALFAPGAFVPGAAGKKKPMQPKEAERGVIAGATLW
jgi:hypothetical protein